MEYLKIFSLDSKENIRAWREACDLSVASLDLESITLEMCSSVMDETLPFRDRTQVRYDSSPRKKQMCVLLGHKDRIEESASFFRVTEDKPLIDVMVDYIIFLKKRREQAMEKKKQLLKPLFDVLEPLQKAHFDYCSRQDNLSEALPSYQATLPGRFHRHLQKLIDRFVIFSFNGASYDHVMISAALAMACKRMNTRNFLRMNRRGNRIISMTLHGPGLKGTHFRDLCCLLDRSVSLASLSKTCGLKESKALFPFGQLDSLSSLDKTEFSWNLEDWRNDLTGNLPEQEAVDEAKRKFRELECRSVFDYLLHYLALDVE